MSNLKNVQTTKTIREDLEFRINREIGFVQEVTTSPIKQNTIYGQTIDQLMVYVKKIGGIDEYGLGRLEKIGLKFCYLNPIEIKNTEFGKSKHGIMIVLELV